MRSYTEMLLRFGNLQPGRTADLSKWSPEELEHYLRFADPIAVKSLNTTDSLLAAELQRRAERKKGGF